MRGSSPIPPDHSREVPLQDEGDLPTGSSWQVNLNGSGNDDVVLDIKDVSFDYGSDSSSLLDHISLQVHAGETLGIIGLSGTGKSTLLRLIAGLEAPLEGTIEVTVRDQKDASAPVNLNPIMVFQDLALFPWRSVEGNAMLGLELMGMPGKQRKERAAEVLAIVGMSAHASKLPHELSGGMKQRAALARALAVDPPLLLLDEPFAALDAHSRMIMQAEVSQIMTRIGGTVILVTHAIDEAVFMSDRVLVLSPRPGRLSNEMRIALPRPRDVDIRLTSDFKNYVDELLGKLQTNILSTMAVQ
jgi:NitT/TauT family transport system ATP-binding protein